LPVVELEEQHLRQIFPGLNQPGFAEYAGRVPRLVPKLGRVGAGGKRFKWSGYRHNREYEALVAFLAAVAVLVWKLLA